MFHARRGHFPFFLFSAVLSSLRMGKPSVAIHPDVLEATHPAAIPPPEPPPGGENLALLAEGVGYFLSLFLRCSALSLSSVRSSASRLARVVLVNTRHLLCGSRTFFLLPCFVFEASSACLQGSPLGVCRLSNGVLVLAVCALKSSFLWQALPSSFLIIACVACQWRVLHCI